MVDRYDSLTPKLMELKRKYWRQILLYMLFIIGVPIITFAPFFIWMDEKYSDLFLIVLFFNMFFLVLFPMTLIKRSGFGARLKVYSSILVEDPSAKIIEAQKKFFSEKFVYETNGKRFPGNFVITFFHGGRATKPCFEIFSDYKSPFDIGLLKLGNLSVFETDNKNYLKFKSRVDDFRHRDRIGSGINGLSGDSHELKDETRYSNLFKILEIMNEIQAVSQKGGETIKRSEASETFSYWWGPAKATVCLPCENILGRWKEKDHVNIPKCPTCGSETVVILPRSKNDTVEKIKLLKLYK